MSPQEVHDVYSQLVIPEDILKENGYLYFEEEQSKRPKYKKDKWSVFSFMPDNGSFLFLKTNSLLILSDSTRKCTRCSRLFNRKSTFFSPNVCRFHPLKTENKNGVIYHSCCLKRFPSIGCQTHPSHVHQQPSESALDQFVQAPKPVSTRDFRSNKVNLVFGLDVEMIHTENGLEAARISLVDVNRRVMIDEYIKPEGKIVHLNTEFSGIKSFHLEKAKSLEQIHNLLFQFMNRSSVLVGHGLSNDLKVLRLVHLNVIDTALLIRSENGNMQSLKTIAKSYLNENIQWKEGGHDSVEDSITCLRIVEKLIHVLIQPIY
uniref:Exonuclease domain-containing protein n=1 Tax=Caenorhabditis tropicalis TaxID=1561998 RepID=A0A1I7T9G7_9PELO